MFEPGYYKTNYRAVRLRETVRWRGWRGGLLWWIFTRFMPVPRRGIWMPGLWTDNDCKRDDLSQYFWDLTRRHRADFERLGFAQCRLTKVERSLDPLARDTGTIFYLDPTRCYLGQLIYSQYYMPAKKKVFNHVALAFTAVFESGSFSCTNNRLVFDSASGGEVVRINSRDLTQIYDRFREELRRRTDVPHPFADADALRQWFNARQIRNFEDHVRRGLFVRMTEPEVAAAEVEMQRYGPGPGKALPPPPDRRRLALKLMPATLALVLLASLIIYRHRHISENTIDYRGQQFKLNRSYEDFDDYKDDPNNLDTNELGRIERTMESVEIPATFKDSKEFIYTTTSIEFPGYGQSVTGGQTDDGSTLQIISTEIPQADKERVVVGQSESGDSWRVVDDFIYAGSDTNDINHVQLKNRQLEYFDQKGNLFRKKGI